MFFIMTNEEFLKRLSVAIPIMQARGKKVDCLLDMVDRIHAIYPNPETYLDLHELYLKEAEQPIYPLYLTKFEVFCLQVMGYVPERDTELYKELNKDFRRDEP